MPEKKTVKKRTASKKIKETAPETAAAFVEVPAAIPAQESYFESVRRKAYELYEKRGKQYGLDRHDWFLAENELNPSAGK